MIRFPCLILKGEIFVVPIWGGTKYGFSARSNFQSRRFEKECGRSRRETVRAFILAL